MRLVITPTWSGRTRSSTSRVRETELLARRRETEPTLPSRDRTPRLEKCNHEGRYCHKDSRCCLVVPSERLFCVRPSLDEHLAPVCHVVLGHGPQASSGTNSPYGIRSWK